MSDHTLRGQMIKEHSLGDRCDNGETFTEFCSIHPLVSSPFFELRGYCFQSNQAHYYLLNVRKKLGAFLTDTSTWSSLLFAFLCIYSQGRRTSTSQAPQLPSFVKSRLFSSFLSDLLRCKPKVAEAVRWPQGTEINYCIPSQKELTTALVGETEVACSPVEDLNRKLLIYAD